MPPLLKSLDDRLIALYARIVDGLCDPARRGRTALVAALVYAAIWTLYGIVSKSTQDINADLAEMVVWTREMAWGFPKHPPFLAWVLKLWFSVFPLADWSFYLLAMGNCALSLWLAWKLAGEWLTGAKRAAAPFLLALIPFYNFLAFKFDQNTALTTLWALAMLGLVRSLKTQHLGWALVTGLAAAAAMLTKYWSAFFLLALFAAAAVDRNRAAYWRSPAPYVTALVAATMFLPHFLWLVQNDFPPIRWVANRRQAEGLGDWLRAASGYVVATIGYAGVVLAIYAVMARPGLALLRETVWPADAARRRAALLMWIPILLPLAVSAATGTKLLSVWNIPALNLLPVLLLSPPAVALAREQAARIAGIAMVVSLGALLASPIVAYVALKTGVENDAPYARQMMAEADKFWKEGTDKPLRLIGGVFGPISTASFYGAGQPSTYADFSPYLSPWATPQRIARDGLVAICPLNDADYTAWCLRHMDAMTANVAGVRKRQVEKRRAWLGFAGPPKSFLMAAIPPR